MFLASKLIPYCFTSKWHLTLLAERFVPILFLSNKQCVSSVSAGKRCTDNAGIKPRLQSVGCNQGLDRHQIKLMGGSSHSQSELLVFVRLEFCLRL